ncbi:MAG: CDP-alcohol phosphatidyltransferase family protein [Deltaproteobacteria bacterium]|nr:CDP-alcohol phosphatidyltransferase family protein [Deltaproteobacteria bacterium]
METKRFLRYLAPNLVTFGSLCFGMLSILSSIEGRYCTAAWFIIFSVLADKLDGLVARVLKGTSQFGVQMDSFADALNFGVAPAVLWYSFLSRAPGLHFAEDDWRTFLAVACCLWVVAVTFRLARYNIVGDNPKYKKIFIGVPTTLAGGTLVALFLAALKYGRPEIQAAAQATFDEPYLLGSSFHLGVGIWHAWPVLVLVGAYLMVSTVKIPKLGPSRSRPVTVFVLANVLAGYVLGFAMLLPEYLFATSGAWTVGSLIWSQFSTQAKGIKPPAIFPDEVVPPVDLAEPEVSDLPELDDETDSSVATAK